jgi:hypothetical protein
MQSNPFQQGCLIAVFSPLMTATQALLHIAADRTSMTVAPHVFLPVRGTRPAVFDIPWVSQLKRFNSAKVSTQTIGTLSLIVWSPLQTGVSSAATTANVTVFASFVGLDFQVLDPTQSYVRTRVRGPDGVYSRPDATPEGEEDIKEGGPPERINFAGRSYVAVPDVTPDKGYRVRPEAAIDPLSHPKETQNEQGPGGSALSNTRSEPANLSADPGLVTAADEVASAVVSPQERPQPVPPELGKQDNICHAIRRAGIVLRSPIAGNHALQTASFFKPTSLGAHPTGPVCGQLAYFARLYRVWRGGFHVTTRADEIRMNGFIPDARADMNQYALSVMLDDNRPQPCYPIALGTRKAGFTKVKIPFKSEYHVLKTPLALGDYSDRECSSGQLGLTMSDVENDSLVFAAPSDDFRFGYLFQVPHIRVDGTQADRVEPEGNFTSNVSNIKNIAEGSIDFAAAAQGSGNGKLEAAADYPNVGVDKLAIVRAPLPDLAPNVGVHQSSPLTDFPGDNRILSNVEVGAEENEMDISYLTQKMTWSASFNWSVDDPAGFLLLWDCLSPAPKSEAVAPGTSLRVTLLEYVSKAYTFWRGSLCAMIQLFPTPMHTGRLLIVSCYARDVSTLTWEEAQSQYGYIVDMSGEQTTFKVQFPWRSDREKLRVPRDNTDVLSDVSMGTWGIFVLNPLVANESVAQAVDVQVFLAAGDDFELDWPGPIRDMILDPYV